jgi:hypothetical protein
LPTPVQSRNQSLVIVVSLTVVAGMAIALVVILLWTKYPALVAGGAGMRAAIGLCPPFMLVQVVGGTNDSTMGLIITTGTIVIANASLYAGLAAFVYWVMTTFWLGRQKQ